MNADVIELFLIGFSSYFGPCMLFCSPVVIPYIIGTREKFVESLKSLIIFSISRLLVTVILGMIVAIAGKILIAFFRGFSGYFYLFFGIIIIFSAVLIITGKKHIFGNISFKNNPANIDLVIYGALTALIPCAPKLGAFAYISLKADNLAAGLLYSLAFGIGEFISPLLFLGIVILALPSSFNYRFKRLFSYLSAVILLILGIKFIILAFGI